MPNGMQICPVPAGNEQGSTQQCCSTVTLTPTTADDNWAPVLGNKFRVGGLLKGVGFYRGGVAANSSNWTHTV